MATSYSYPGVYVEEVPSGVRTITGVSTSNTAFVDFFARGPMERAVRISSFGDFEREFGGLDERSEASYGIQQYYRNGGQIAWVVRVAGGTPAPAGVVLLDGDDDDALTLEAVSPGVWGSNLQVGIDYRTSDPDTLFNLVVREVRVVNGRDTVVESEVHRNLSMDPEHVRYVVDTIERDSRLIRVTVAAGEERPAATGADVTSPAVISDTGNVIPAEGEAPEEPAPEPEPEPEEPGEEEPEPEPEPEPEEPGEEEPEPPAAPTPVFLAFGALPAEDEEEDPVEPSDGTAPGSAALVAGMRALDRIAPDVFNILCLPGAANLVQQAMFSVLADAQAYCLEKRAFLIVDIPADVASPAAMTTWLAAAEGNGLRSRNAAVYFPRLTMANRLKEDRPRDVGPSGTLAGLYARTDATRGVWKAPAGTEANLVGARLAVQLTDPQNGALNPLGVNALRNFPIYGGVAWGARTLEGADQQASEWKYIPVRRLALYLEESLYQGLKWVVFEPNDEPLWGQIRLNVSSFMQNLFRQGAFQGKTPRDAYLVKCDAETTTQYDIDRGIVNILVGFAPLKPAEFVVLKLQQLAGQTQS